MGLRAIERMNFTRMALLAMTGTSRLDAAIHTLHTFCRVQSNTTMATNCYNHVIKRLFWRPPVILGRPAAATALSTLGRSAWTSLRQRTQFSLFSLRWADLEVAWVVLEVGDGGVAAVLPRMKPQFCPAALLTGTGSRESRSPGYLGETTRGCSQGYCRRSHAGQRWPYPPR
jgi:hypothetical protein